MGLGNRLECGAFIACAGMGDCGGKVRVRTCRNWGLGRSGPASPTWSSLSPTSSRQRRGRDLQAFQVARPAAAEGAPMEVAQTAPETTAFKSKALCENDTVSRPLGSEASLRGSSSAGLGRGQTRQNPGRQPRTSSPWHRTCRNAISTPWASALHRNLLPRSWPTRSRSSSPWPGRCPRKSAPVQMGPGGHLGAGAARGRGGADAGCRRRGGLRPHQRQIGLAPARGGPRRLSCAVPVWPPRKARHPPNTGGRCRVASPVPFGWPTPSPGKA